MQAADSHTSLQKQLSIDPALEELNKYLEEEKSIMKDEAEELEEVKRGHRYTKKEWFELPELRDEECRQPSRCLLVKLLME